MEVTFAEPLELGWRESLAELELLIQPPLFPFARAESLYIHPQKACELVKQAIDADVKQDWAEAFKLYKCVPSASPLALTS